MLFAGRPVDAVPACVEHVFDLGDGYEALLAGAEPADFPDDLSEDTLAGLFYTGGTTGASKGVMLTHRNLVANALHYQVCAPFTPDTCWLIVAPLFHAAGSIAVLATVWNGGRHVVLPAFDAGAALDLVERHGVTDTLVVPDDARRHGRGAARAAARRRLAARASATAARRSPRRRSAAPTPPSPTPSCMHIYGATETAPIATVLPHEERVLDRPEVALVRSAGGRRRGARRRARRRSARPPARWGRCSSAATT